MWEIQFSEAVERWYERVPRDVAEQFLDRLFDCVEGWMHVGPPEEAGRCHPSCVGSWKLEPTGSLVSALILLTTETQEPQVNPQIPHMSLDRYVYCP